MLSVSFGKNPYTQAGATPRPCISHLPATMEMTASIYPFLCRRKPLSFHGLLFQCRAPKKKEILQARRSFGLPGLGSESIPFCLTRWETLKRLALEGGVNCVACSSVISSNADAIETAGVETSLDSLIFFQSIIVFVLPSNRNQLLPTCSFRSSATECLILGTIPSCG